MTQKIKPTKLSLFFNNVLSRREALMWVVILIGLGIAIGVLTR